MNTILNFVSVDVYLKFGDYFYYTTKKYIILLYNKEVTL